MNTSKLLTSKKRLRIAGLSIIAMAVVSALGSASPALRVAPDETRKHLMRDPAS